MEEIEVPLESVHEQTEHASHEGHHTPHASWITWAALLSALLAVMAAVTALNAGSRVNEAMMNRMKASDQWGYYQAKGIKAAVLETRSDLYAVMGKEVPEKAKEKLVEYATQQKEIQEKADHFEKESEENFEQHEIFSHAVTYFQIAIAVTAIAVLAKKRRFLIVTGVFGTIGTVYAILGFLFHGH